MKKIILIMLFALIPTIAQAQQGPSCRPHDEVAKFLTEKHGEQVAGIGVARNHAVEFYVSERGTWSFVVTSPDGISCIMAVGADWQTLTPEYGNPNETDS